MDRLSKKNWILYTENAEYKTCDVCDEHGRTVTYSVMGSVNILCLDCVKELYDTIIGAEDDE